MNLYTKTLGIMVVYIWGRARFLPSTVGPSFGCVGVSVLGEIRAPRDHTNIKILQHVISGIPLILGLGTRM